MFRSCKEIYQFFGVNGSPPAGKLTGFAFDSREVKEGNLFFALKGARVDGHHYLEDVAKKGALCACVDRDYKGIEPLPLIRVLDVEKTLKKLAQEKMSRHPAEVIALTGSLGKTTTKEFLKTLLQQAFTVAWTPKSYNSQLGLPLSILNMSDSVEKIVLEMGMTGRGHIQELVSIAPPDIAALISLSEVHIGYFKGIEELFKAKAEIFSSDRTKHALVYDELMLFAAEPFWGKAKLHHFSTKNPDAEFYIKGEGQKLAVFQETEKKEFIWAIPGEHNYQNLLAAIALARLAKTPWDAIIQGISLLSLPERRFQVNKAGGITFVDDSYNACEDSILAALKALPPVEAGGKRYMVFGDIVELGDISRKIHRNVGKIISENVDEFFCLGEKSIDVIEANQGVLMPSKEAVKEVLLQRLKPGDVVLFKGSNPHALWELEQDLRRAFS